MDNAGTRPDNRSKDFAKLDSDAMVVDLSRHIHKLTQYEDISSDLSADEEQRLVSYVKAMVDMSHSRISKRYNHWLEADRAHDVYVRPDATEFREKAVIADTRAIADTVITYIMSALTGRNPMFQLEGLNRSSRRSAAIMERVLHQQLRRTAGEARIAQQIMDEVRYGYAPTKIVWDNKTNQNQLINFNPRRAFYDPRVTWGDWENMQFMVFTDFVPFNALYKSGMYPKLKTDPELRKPRNISQHGWQAHKFNQEEGRGLSIDPAKPNEGSNHTISNFTLGSARPVDEAWVSLAGYEIGVPSIEEIYLVLTIIDEQTVIRCQLNPYGQQLPVSIGGLYNDSHKSHGQSLYDILLPLHDIATWLLRSRVDNVQASLNNLIFADPTRINIPDLIDRNPWGIVQTLPGVDPNDGIYISQVPDVTKGHWNDIQAMSELKQRVSAASDAQQGMPTSDGIRTATEIQRLTQLGSQRLGVLSRVISATTMRPQVRMMVSNIQDALSTSGSIALDPTSVPSHLQGDIQDGYLDYDTLQDLQGDIDYLVVDGTLPVEPTRNAETWMNMLQIMSQTGLNMEYNVGKIAEEGIRSLGISDLDQFRISKEQQQEGLSPSQQVSMMEKMRGASVQPNEQIQNEVQKGNLVPMKQAQGGRR